MKIYCPCCGFEVFYGEEGFSRSYWDEDVRMHRAMYYLCYECQCQFVVFARGGNSIVADGVSHLVLNNI